MPNNAELEEIYARLKVLKNELEEIHSETFSFKKAYNHCKNTLLDIIEDLSYLEESNELLDDDWFEKRNQVVEEEKNPEEIKPKNVIDLNDLVG